MASRASIKNVLLALVLVVLVMVVVVVAPVFFDAARLLRDTWQNQQNYQT